MESIKQKIDDFLYILKNENPNANWKNLVTGSSIVLVLLVFSVWYFYKNREPTIVDQLRRGSRLQVQEDFTSNGKGTGSILGNTIPADTPEFVEVLPGEGIWHVAKRVCGDGEKYKFIADANNLHIHWTRLAVGQKLKVDCGN